jgi:hypothetical protein
MRDEDIEGRLGFTFQKRICNAYIALIPFIGYGHACDINKFEKPSPLPVKFHTSFDYISFGLFSSCAFKCHYSIGFNFKGKYMLNGKNHITGDPDPECEDLDQVIDTRMQYIFELPLSYCCCFLEGCFEVELVPFYQLRHYGGHVNFPYDFLDTKLKMYGARLVASYRF